MDSRLSRSTTMSSSVALSAISAAFSFVRANATTWPSSMARSLRMAFTAVATWRWTLAKEPRTGMDVTGRSSSSGSAAVTSIGETGKPLPSASPVNFAGSLMVRRGDWAAEAGMVTGVAGSFSSCSFPSGSSGSSRRLIRGSLKSFRALGR